VTFRSTLVSPRRSTGGIALVHARLIRELGGDLVGVCGRTLESAHSFGAAPAYGDIARLLKDQKPDVVHVCSPNHLHAPHSIAAFRADSHVLCEKPMATSTAECRLMIEAASAAGRVGAIAYTYRGYPIVEVLRNKVAEGHFGSLRRIGGCYLSQNVLAAEKYVWLFTPETTDGSYALMDLGVHWLDLVEYVTGSRIRAITAQFSTHQRERIWPVHCRNRRVGYRRRNSRLAQPRIVTEPTIRSVPSALTVGVTPFYT